MHQAVLKLFLSLTWIKVQITQLSTIFVWGTEIHTGVWSASSETVSLARLAQNVFSNQPVLMHLLHSERAIMWQFKHQKLCDSDVLGKDNYCTNVLWKCFDFSTFVSNKYSDALSMSFFCGIRISSHCLVSRSIGSCLEQRDPHFCQGHSWTR